MFGTATKPVRAVPVSRTRERRQSEPGPDSAQPVAAFGHAPDYHWLLGTLERASQSSWELRYQPADREDVWGGKVALPSDSRLASFKAGDLVVVEGSVAELASHRPALYEFQAVHLLWRPPS
jgi:hypothetical protein